MVGCSRRKLEKSQNQQIPIHSPKNNRDGSWAALALATSSKKRRQTRQASKMKLFSRVAVVALLSAISVSATLLQGRITSNETLELDAAITISTLSPSPSLFRAPILQDKSFSVIYSSLISLHRRPTDPVLIPRRLIFRKEITS